ncbi:alpha/beta fold hydrolase [Streptomyces sp. NPDC041068]|uniref:thioesterase II family protein n=1 Tax=Streptomyces sp. NPDC041068 TaxID=3155130 RepID=UPI00340A01A7
MAQGSNVPRGTRALKVLCLPYAGAGAGVYRPWQHDPGPALSPIPIQLPGREEEFSLPHHHSMAAAVADVVRRVRAAADGEPFVLFGHSLGAVLAHEAARQLLASGGPIPRHLVVSGSVSPRRRRPPRPFPTDPDAFTVARLRELTGAPLETLEHPELRDLLLPALLADLALLDDYRPPQDPAPLPLPITAIRGSSDATVPVLDWQDWEAYTSAAFRGLQLPGGHMYLTDSWPSVRQTLERLA